MWWDKKYKIWFVKCNGLEIYSGKKGNTKVKVVQN